MKRATPPILLLAFGLEIAFRVARLVQRLIVGVEHSYAHVDRWQLAGSGVWALFTVMVGIGLFDLARQLTGRAAVGARLAGVMFVAQFALGAAMNLVLMIAPADAAWLWNVHSHMLWLTATIAAVGLASSAWRHSPALAIGAFAICMLARPPEVVSDILYKGLGLGFTGMFVLFTALGILHALGIVALVIAASDGVAAPRRELAITGFNLASNALILRVVAAAAGVALTLLAMAASTGRGAGGSGILKLTLFAGLAVNLLSFAMFGIGALRVARSELAGIPRWTGALAAACSLWCMGVMLEQLPHDYGILYGDGDRGSVAQDSIAALSVVTPLVGMVSGGLFAAVIASLARARGHEALVGRATGAGLAYVLLMLASTGIQSYLLESVGSLVGLVRMLLLAAGCGLVAQVILGRLCGRASVDLDDTPGLPKAVATINAPT